MSQNTEAPVRHYSSTAFVFDGTPRRDERFPDPYNMGVNAEAFLYDEEMPPNAKVLMMFYKRIREIDVPEMMSSILHETKGKPWSYYRDMTRQLWDEARHAMMGEVGFVSEGIDWPRLVMVNSTWSRALNTQLTPKERHAVLYFIEQGLMPKTGKRHEWVVSKEAGNPLATTFQDFDWADEVLHARIGRDWYVADMPDAKEAIGYGDTCWGIITAEVKALHDGYALINANIPARARKRLRLSRALLFIFQKIRRRKKPKSLPASASLSVPRASAIRNPRDCQALGVPHFSCEAAFLLDAMAALPRKWVSGGLRLGDLRVGEKRRPKGA